ncbi:MAG: hypothetical protein WAW37_13935 [Syntrophobacteraceae bacterium]
MTRFFQTSGLLVSMALVALDFIGRVVISGFFLWLGFRMAAPLVRIRLFLNNRFTLALCLWCILAVIVALFIPGFRGEKIARIRIPRHHDQEKKSGYAKRDPK